ncbi:hypothetical protein H0H81_012570 [Sphagnurus paluster]|uniref:Major facilitator superfamily (MFS) profile domain-containing protein n=1 Tax=Sphagnurus paluster TaxID=117069 RepID=A0A9P7KFI6_9AGAR|nr:hypothetical protein H0H81_012570 [Sphagnurus paluster]
MAPRCSRRIRPSATGTTTLWGVMADLIGRKLSFNMTLFLAGVFGIAAGAAHNFVTFASLVACIGFGIGGNLPVDGALYLEHIPQSHQVSLIGLIGKIYLTLQTVDSNSAISMVGHRPADRIRRRMALHWKLLVQ